MERRHITHDSLNRLRTPGPTTHRMLIVWGILARPLAESPAIVDLRGTAERRKREALDWRIRKALRFPSVGDQRQFLASMGFTACSPIPLRHEATDTVFA